MAVAECKNFSAKIKKTKVDFKALGYRGVQYKATGWEGSGSMEIYYASSRWAKMLIEYAKTGKDTYFKLQASNEDPTSAIGRQTVTLTDVNLDDSEITKLNTESQFLTESINFTFSGVEIPEEFTELNS